MTTTKTIKAAATAPTPDRATIQPPLVAYRPGATADTPNLLHYAVIGVHGRLAIMAASPEDAPVHSLHRRTSSGRVMRFPLNEGITAWLSGDNGDSNPAGTQVALQLTDPWMRVLDSQVIGPVVFTGTDHSRPIGLSPRQVEVLREAHAQASHWVSD